MKKILLVLFILLTFRGSALCFDHTLQEQEQEKVDPRIMAYNKAITAPSLNEKIRLFKEYLNTWTDSIYHKYVYTQLALSYYQLKKFGEVILNGEKALGYKDLEAEWKVQIFLILADSYASDPHKKDLKKALSYAERALNLAKAQGLTQFVNVAENAKNTISGLINKGEAGKVQSLFAEKKYAEVIALVNKLDESVKNNFDILRCYALSLYRTKKIDAALNNFRKAYSIKKTGEIANFIAIILYSKSKKDKKLLDECIKYFVKAGHLFSKEKKQKMSKKAMARARHLFFNGKHGLNKKIKAIEAKYKDVEREYYSLAKEYNALAKKYEDKEDIPEEDEKKMELMKKRIDDLEIKLEDKEIEIEEIQDEQKRLNYEFKKLLASIKV
ncbi:MAG: hypothetical protein ACE5WD_00955 [Candidatus Aminicenantia bacterium]